MRILSLVTLLAFLLPLPAGAEMVNRENFRLMPTQQALERRALCGPFEGNPDVLVYQLVTGRCEEPGTRWDMPDAGEVQVTRAWARLGYLAYQVLLLDLQDDSVAAEEWRFELTPVDDQRWQLDFAGQRWRCWEGRGRSEGFTTTPCF